MRDAEPFNTATRRDWTVVPARHAYIWLHTAGAWREGHILHWMHLNDGRWALFAAFRHPQRWGYPAYEHFLYDPDTVRPRHDERPPAD